MNTLLRRRIRHSRRWLGYGLLVLLILLALLVSVANQLLPMVERHPERIADWLSARVGEPVSFSAAHAEWTRRGPRFILDGLHVGEGASKLAVGRAQLQVAMYSGLLPGRPLTELKIRDLSLTLRQGSDGRWQVIGLPGQDGRSDPLERLEGFGELQIERARLAIIAPALGVNTNLPRVDARIRVDGPRLRVGVLAWIDQQDLPLAAVLDFQRNQRNGLLWIGGTDLKLAHWNDVLAATGVSARQGTAQLGMWATLRDQRVSRVTVQADIAEARLQSKAVLTRADGSSVPARVSFDRLQANARWSLTRNGWRIQAPRLNVTRGDKVAHLDNLLIDGGKQFRLLGPQLDLSPLAAMLSLSDRLPTKLRLFLLQSDPRAILHDVVIQGVRDGPLHGSMAISDLVLQPYAQRPGFSGLAGRLQFDERGGVLRLDTTPVHVAWPAGLRQSLDVRLAGTMALWKSAPGWTLGSDRLRIQGDDFGANVRLQLGFQGDGTAPTIELAANLDPATFATAKKFWIMHKMSESSVSWLDHALVSGDIVDGRVALGGDLDDWPFRNRHGNFDARASIRNATLKFNEHWPAGNDLDIDIHFNGPGFDIDGRGSLLENRISHVTGGIEQFAAPWLDLDIQADTPGESLRQLLMASPLDADYGEHLRALTISGDAKVLVKLHLPLRAALGHKTITGTLDLERASLADSRWDLQFTDVSGRTRYTDHGFATQDLRVKISNQPGVFNLRVGDTTGDRSVAALATLDGRFPASTLIDRYQDLAWLKPLMSGSANWNIGVRIPAASKQSNAPSQLRVSSDLVGISLSLPAPLKKAESAVLPLEVLLPLPIERGDLNLRLGSLMRLRGQIRKGAPITGAIQFGNGALAASPVSGLSVRGSVPVLDSMGWVAFSGTGGGGGKSPIHDVDVQAGQLIFLDRAFPDARVQLNSGTALTQIAIKAKGIEGTVEIPGDLARGVQGRFTRLHLPSDATAGADSASPASVAASPVVEDPSRLPPLSFNIADLRIGQARLGKAELVTRPMASGLRVEKFNTQTRNLRLSAAGEWVRAGSGTRSNFLLDFNANSLGQMLDALGYADMVQDGKTKATLAGSWPGSPGAFSLATLSGNLKAEVGAGRLLDVEPGGSGRVLGLLSLAEIPRRLSLDFSDFFEKGFSFNTARGDFVFNDGKARTDNLRIDGPAAEIRVSGSTGLRDQVYDQRVEVLPKAGGLLPAIGLIAGGPAGAAVGVMAQAVLQRSLKQTTRVVYRVTGPWLKPVVKVIEKGPERGGNGKSGR